MNLNWLYWQPFFCDRMFMSYVSRLVAAGTFFCMIGGMRCSVLQTTYIFETVILHPFK